MVLEHRLAQATDVELGALADHGLRAFVPHPSLG